MTRRGELLGIAILCVPVVALLCIIILGGLLALSEPPRDDTDQPDNKAPRSGIQPHTDAATGCQYLSTPLGGITPRLDAHGQQLGCRR